MSKSNLSFIITTHTVNINGQWHWSNKDNSTQRTLKSIERETCLQQAKSGKLASCTFFRITLSKILNQHECVISIEYRSATQLALIYACTHQQDKQNIPTSQVGFSEVETPLHFLNLHKTCKHFSFSDTRADQKKKNPACLHLASNELFIHPTGILGQFGIVYFYFYVSI